MVHDPRAPRLAAIATLGAAVLVLFTALNLVFNLVGSTGLSMEEGAAGAGVVVLLLVASLANKEREIPELSSNISHGDIETFEALTTSRSEPTQTEVNPTTASILSSILGEQPTADQHQVNAAIHTLSSGAFGDSVRQTVAAVETANQKPTTPREAAPADEMTGETLERVVVESVPLPGQSPETVVDQRSIPGLDPNRVFVTDGVKSVPLPSKASVQEDSTPITTSMETNLPSARPSDTRPPQATTTPELPELPALPDMLDLPDLDDGQEHHVEETIVQAPVMELPDLDDLFAEDDQSLPTGLNELPELPELDDLF